jgi:hypothetical protein
LDANASAVHCGASSDAPLARKYPESIELSGGEGREPLSLEWIEPDYEKVLGRRR